MNEMGVFLSHSPIFCEGVIYMGYGKIREKTGRSSPIKEIREISAKKSYLGHAQNKAQKIRNLRSIWDC